MAWLNEKGNRSDRHTSLLDIVGFGSAAAGVDVELSNLTVPPMTSMTVTPNARDHAHELANSVIDACVRQEAVTLRGHLESGASPNSKWQGKTKRYDIPCRNGKGDICKAYFEVTAGTSALYVALGAFAFPVSREIVTLLLEHGANVNEKGLSDRYVGQFSYPLMIAALSKSPDTVELLLDKRANPNETNRLGWNSLLLASLEVCDKTHPLHGVPFQPQVVQLLIRAGARLEFSNPKWNECCGASIAAVVDEVGFSNNAKSIIMSPIPAFLKYALSQNLDEAVLKTSADPLSDALRLCRYFSEKQDLTIDEMTDDAYTRATIMATVAQHILVSKENIAQLMEHPAFSDHVVAAGHLSFAAEPRLRAIVDKIFRSSTCRSRMAEFYLYNMLYVALLGSLLEGWLPSRLFNGNRHHIRFDVLLILWTFAVGVKESFQAAEAVKREEGGVRFGLQKYLLDFWNILDVSFCVCFFFGCFTRSHKVFVFTFLLTFLRMLHPLSIMFERAGLIIQVSVGMVRVLVQYVFLLSFLVLAFSMCFALMSSAPELNALVRPHSVANATSVPADTAYSAFLLTFDSWEKGGALLDHAYASNTPLFVLGLFFNVFVGMGMINMVIGAMAAEAQIIEPTSRARCLLERLAVCREFRWPTIVSMLPPPFTLLMLPFVLVPPNMRKGHHSLWRVTFILISKSFVAHDIDRTLVTRNLGLGDVAGGIYYWLRRVTFIHLSFHIFAGTTNVWMFVVFSLVHGPFLMVLGTAARGLIYRADDEFITHIQREMDPSVFDGANATAEKEESVVEDKAVIEAALRMAKSKPMMDVDVMTEFDELQARLERLETSSGRLERLERTTFEIVKHLRELHSKLEAK
eukprot:TRINITY_DN4124_c0_g1_i1.p1 TRINITY_DN4124_c0_g1~~TRINITY_DN4124_c0_g1_i1.p1  ORF type:complete len:861 (-),score=110.15 TRINITY_DN4124_c0_g1_i1:118-2700(-)